MQSNFSSYLKSRNVVQLKHSVLQAPGTLTSTLWGFGMCCVQQQNVSHNISGGERVQS